MSLTLFKAEVSDPYVRDNFKRLADYLTVNSLLIGFKHIEITFDAAESNRKVYHPLGFKPRDIIQTSLTGSGTVTWNYSLFDSNYLNISATGPCVVRAFYGTYQEQ